MTNETRKNILVYGSSISSAFVGGIMAKLGLGVVVAFTWGALIGVITLVVGLELSNRGKI
jgi:predicted lipid-binding transport protein (Tim44 family)